MESLWSWLNTPPTVSGVFDLFGVAYVAVFAVGFVVSAHLAGSGRVPIAASRKDPAGVRHWANVGLWLFGPGLFCFLIRALQINPLSFGEPIWLVGCMLALLAAAKRWLDWRRSTRRRPWV